MALKVIAYIDGYNLYSGLKSADWRKYYWLDFVGLVEKFINQQLEELVAVNYFSFRVDNPDRLNDLLDANISHNNKFKVNKLDKYSAREGKIRIALEMIRNIDESDVLILVCGDKAFAPVFEYIRSVKPQYQVKVFFPPKIISHDLQKVATGSWLLEQFESRFKKNLLPEIVTLKNGIEIHRPPKWY